MGVTPPRKTVDSDTSINAASQSTRVTTAAVQGSDQPTAAAVETPKDRHATRSKIQSVLVDLNETVEQDPDCVEHVDVTQLQELLSKLSTTSKSGGRRSKKGDSASPASTPVRRTARSRPGSASSSASGPAPRSDDHNPPSHDTDQDVSLGEFTHLHDSNSTIDLAGPSSPEISGQDGPPSRSGTRRPRSMIVDTSHRAQPLASTASPRGSHFAGPLSGRSTGSDSTTSSGLSRTTHGIYQHQRVSGSAAFLPQWCLEGPESDFARRLELDSRSVDKHVYSQYMLRRAAGEIRHRANSRDMRACMDVKQDLEGVLGVSADVRVYTALISALGKCRRVDMVEDLVEEMKGRHVYPNNQTWTAIFSALAEARVGDLIPKYLYQMQYTYHQNPDGITLTCIIKAYTCCGMVEEAHSALEMMRMRNLVRDQVAFNMVAQGYAARGDTVRVLNLVEELRRLGIRPDRNTYGALMSLYIRTNTKEGLDRVVDEVVERKLDIARDVVQRIHQMATDAYKRDMVNGCVRRLQLHGLVQDEDVYVVRRRLCWEGASDSASDRRSNGGSSSRSSSSGRRSYGGSYSYHSHHHY